GPPVHRHATAHELFKPPSVKGAIKLSSGEFDGGCGSIPGAHGCKVSRSRKSEMKGQIGQLMQQAQRMQEEMKRAQEEIGKLEVTGNAGGGMVSVTMSGRHEVRRVQIDRKLLADDPEMAEDMIAAAVNDAVNKVAEASQQKLGGVAQGLNLPPGMKLTF